MLTACRPTIEPEKIKHLRLSDLAAFIDGQATQAEMGLFRPTVSRVKRPYLLLFYFNRLANHLFSHQLLRPLLWLPEFSAILSY